MKAIIAVNNLGFIGLSGGLPWSCKEDLMHFKKMTMGSVLLSGYNTYKTLPPLKDRIVKVWDISRLPTHYVREVDWCIGGKKTYEYFSPYFTELHISHINDNTIGDTTFPDLSWMNNKCKIYNYSFNVD